MTTAATIQKYLTEAFAAIEPEFRAASIKAHVETAHSQLAAWLSRVEKGADLHELHNYANADLDLPAEYVVIPEWLTAAWRGSSSVAWPSWVTGWTDARWALAHVRHTRSVPANAALYANAFAAYRTIASEGGFTANVALATADANRAVNSAKDHFIGKTTQKLVTALGEATLVKLEGNLDFRRGVVTGNVFARLANGEIVKVALSIIVNHRFHPFVEFYQFPARFSLATLDAVGEFKATSEAKLAERYGKPLPAKPLPIGRHLKPYVYKVAQQASEDAKRGVIPADGWAALKASGKTTGLPCFERVYLEARERIAARESVVAKINAAAEADHAADVKLREGWKVLVAAGVEKSFRSTYETARDNLLLAQLAK